MATATQEEQALLANAIRVLVSDLNAKMDEAVNAGLRVHAHVDTVLYTRDTRSPQQISVRIFQEIV